MCSESALSKGERSNNIRRGAILNICNQSRTFNLVLSSGCVSHSRSHTYAQPFSDGNSPDVQQQGTSLGVAKHEHTNTSFPGFRDQ